MLVNFISFFKGSIHRPKNKIIGGFAVPENSTHFKFTVRIVSYKNKNEKFGCGGSLISPNFVLTAAHCVLDKPFVEVTLLKSLSMKSFTYKVSKIISHPNYSAHNMLPFPDLAIIKLEIPIKESDFFVCLPNDNMSQLAGVNLTISGWGRTNTVISSKSNFLMSAFLTALSNNECAKIYEKIAKEKKYPPHKQLIQVPPDILCGDGLVTKSSICMGDSGGRYFT